VTNVSRSADTDSCVLESIDKPFGLILFGASGDLAKKKLIPSVYGLFVNKLLPERFFILGAARTQMADEEFRTRMKEHISDDVPGKWDAFSEHLFYSDILYDDLPSFDRLEKRITEMERALEIGHNRVFYLATPPGIDEDIIRNLGRSGLADRHEVLERIVVEKPFGRDLKSAKSLNALLLEHFTEDKIFRIDHYLGKETVQNILLFRFANSIFEPLWNRSHIDHVQITVAETVGVGHRAGYYDKAGVLRDMFQNHMLQLLSLVAMEPPNVFEANHVRDEKAKIFQAIRPLDLDSPESCVTLGQYTSGEIEGVEVPGYLDEKGVSPGSRTPTYAAMKLFIDNWRWAGVPFYLRTGKRLPVKRTSISIHFKHAPGRMFKNLPVTVMPNVLTFVIQPDEGISLRFQAKDPGSKVCLHDVDMDFSYADHPSFLQLHAYERVLLDCFSGEQLLFVREDGTEAAWKFLTPLLQRLEDRDLPPLPVHQYVAGTWGPEQSDRMITTDGRPWKID